MPTHLLTPDTTEQFESRTEYVKELHEKLKNSFDLARENSMRASSEQKRQHDTKVNPTKIQPGESVYLMRPKPRAGLSPKLQPKFYGPYTVVLILGHNGLIQPEPPARGKSFWVHMDHVRRATKRNRQTFDYRRVTTSEELKEATTDDLANSAAGAAHAVANDTDANAAEIAFDNHENVDNDLADVEIESEDGEADPEESDDGIIWDDELLPQDAAAASTDEMEDGEVRAGGHSRYNLRPRH